MKWDERALRRAEAIVAGIVLAIVAILYAVSRLG